MPFSLRRLGQEHTYRLDLGSVEDEVVPFGKNVQILFLKITTLCRNWSAAKTRHLQ